MRLHILGCRAGMPADGQPSSGYLVEDGDSALLLDCGPGIATALTRPAHSRELAGVLISHLHLDHCHDLLPLGKSLIMNSFGNGAPLAMTEPALTGDGHPRIPLYVPRGATDVLDRWAELFPVGTVPLLDRAFEVAFDVCEYAPDETIRIAGLEVVPHLLRHAAPNCGMRVSADELTLAYTGDTGLHGGLVELARDADLLLAECSLDRPDISEHGHLCAEDAARVAAAAGVGALVLTHFSTADPVAMLGHQARATALFDGPVHLARPGEVIDVTPAFPHIGALS